MTKIYPHPDLSARKEYLPGVGIDGADVPAAEAASLVERGLAVTVKPKNAQPFHNAEPVKLEAAPKPRKPKAKPVQKTAPTPPAEE